MTGKLKRAMALILGVTLLLLSLLSMVGLRVLGLHMTESEQLAASAVPWIMTGIGLIAGAWLALIGLGCDE